MPRYYAKNESSIDFSSLVEAIKQIKIHNNSIRSVAASKKMSHATLTRYVKKIKRANIDVSTVTDESLIDFLKANSVRGAKPLFNAQQEEVLVKYVLKSSDIYYKLNIAKLKSLVYQYAKTIGISYPASWNDNSQASNDWYYSFMKRHRNFSLRTSEQVSQNSAKSFNKEKVNGFFNNLRSVLAKTPFEPHRIWNMGECRLPTVSTEAVKVSARKDKQRIGSSTSIERGSNVSMALSVSASGQSIPPFFLFPRKRVRDVYMTHASHGAIGIANGCGWMTLAEFTKYMDFFIKHTGANVGSPTLLLLDNHISQLFIEAIDKAVEHGITMLAFPPYFTHSMQPLEVTIFDSLKTSFTQLNDDWKKSCMDVVFGLHHVPLIVGICLDIIATPKNIISGFKSTGIYPFDATVLAQADFVAGKLSEGNQCIDNEDSDTEIQRCIEVSGVDIETAAHEEVTTSETASTSDIISSASLCDALREVGSLKPVDQPKITKSKTKKKKSAKKDKKSRKRSQGKDGEAPVPKKQKG